MPLASGCNDVLRTKLVNKRSDVDCNLAYIGADFVRALHREFDKVHMNTLYGYGHQQAKSSHAWHKTARSRIGVVAATR